MKKRKTKIKPKIQRANQTSSNKTTKKTSIDGISNPSNSRPQMSDDLMKLKMNQKYKLENAKIKTKDRIATLEYKNEKRRLRNQKTIEKYNLQAAKMNRGKAAGIIKSVGESTSQNVLSLTPMAAVLKDDNELINSTSIKENSTSSSNPNLKGYDLGVSDSYGNERY